MKFLPLVLCGLVLAAGCSKEDGNQLPTSPTTPTAAPQFSITELRAGTGATASAGRVASVRYIGWLYSASAADNKGTQFDAGTFSFTVGSGVIQGFSMGVSGMQVGGMRRVVIPPSLGYGGQANGPIPANSSLIFEIELLAVQ